MRVLLVNKLFPPDGIGGSEQSVKYLAIGLRDLGHEVFVLSEGLQRKDSVSELDGIMVIRVGSPPGYQPNVYALPKIVLEQQRLKADSEYKFSERFREHLLNIRPDVVNLNVVSRPNELWKILDDAGVPFCQTLRSYSMISRDRMFGGGIPLRGRNTAVNLEESDRRKQESRRVRSVIGISRFVVESHLRSCFFGRAGNIEVIGNSYEAPESPGPRLRNENLTFGYAGRIHQSKGLEVLLDAFIRDTKKSNLKIFGEGSAHYVSRLEKCYQNRRITFCGKKPQEEIFKAIDVLVVPSRWDEPFGRVNMEALFYGVPVIAADRGGIPEIIKNGHNGWTFNPDSVSDLGKRLRDVESMEKSALSEFEQNALKSSEKYSVSAVARAYQDFLIKTIKNG